MKADKRLSAGVAWHSDAHPAGRNPFPRAGGREPVAAEPSTHPTLVHVLGTGSGTGKSSVCLGLLAWMIRYGVPVTDMGYIKPMTQCVDPGPVGGFCEHFGISCRMPGPLVFSSGFTREYLLGDTPDPDRLRDQILTVIRRLAVGRRYLFVDGVGHSAVGSVVGISNADLARALYDPVVLLVAGPGIGAVIDSLSLNLGYLKTCGVTRVGVLLNRMSRSVAMEIYPAMVEIVRNNFPGVEFHGWLPALAMPESQNPVAQAEVLADWIGDHLDVGRMLVREQGTV